MRNRMRSLVAVWIAFCALMFSPYAGITDRTAKAPSNRAPQAHASTGTHGRKVSSDLREMMSGARSGNDLVRVILQSRGETGAISSRC